MCGIMNGTGFEKNFLKPEEMSDNKDKRDFRDRDRVNVHEKYELTYWADKFGVSTTQLIQAVEKVGPMVKDVEGFLKGDKK